MRFTEMQDLGADLGTDETDFSFDCDGKDSYAGFRFPVAENENILAAIQSLVTERTGKFVLRCPMGELPRLLRKWAGQIEALEHDVQSRLLP